MRVILQRVIGVKGLLMLSI